MIALVLKVWSSSQCVSPGELLGIQILRLHSRSPESKAPGDSDVEMSERLRQCLCAYIPSLTKPPAPLPQHTHPRTPSRECRRFIFLMLCPTKHLLPDPAPSLDLGHLGLSSFVTMNRILQPLGLPMKPTCGDGPGHCQEKTAGFP